MSTPKDIRKQVRNVLQEHLGEVLTKELVAAMRKELLSHVDARLNAIAKHLQTTLDQIDGRSKDVQAYVVRQAANKP